MEANRDAVDSKGNTFKSAHLYINNEVNRQFQAWAAAHKITAPPLSCSYFCALNGEKIHAGTFFTTTESLNLFIRALKKDIATATKPVSAAEEERAATAFRPKPEAAAGAGAAAAP